jgi:hypothetical protein
VHRHGQFTTQTLHWPGGGDLSRPGINRSYYEGGDLRCLIRTATRDEWTKFAHNFPAIMAALAKREEERKASGGDVLSLPR